MNYEEALKEKSFGYMINEGSGYSHQNLIELSDALTICKQAVEQAEKEGRVNENEYWLQYPMLLASNRIIQDRISELKGGK